MSLQEHWPSLAPHLEHLPAMSNPPRSHALVMKQMFWTANIFLGPPVKQAVMLELPVLSPVIMRNQFDYQVEEVQRKGW